MKYAFVNADGIVVQTIGGWLSEIEQARFLRDYGVLFGAEQIIEVDDATTVWIGGSYTDGVFTPPPAPEPQPEPLPEPQLEPEA